MQKRVSSASRLLLCRRTVIAMTNIELFKIYAGEVFALLYEEFPMPWQINSEEMVRRANIIAIEVDQTEYKRHRQICKQTTRWLAETGYLIEGGRDAANPTFVLSAKGFASLAAHNSEGKAIGETLVAATKENGLAHEIGGEARRAAISESVGQIIGAVAKTFMN